MQPIVSDYLARFPMTPIGGLFILPVALCVLAGGILPRWRERMVWVGFALGTLAVTLLAGRASHGLPPASRLQVASLVLALIVEFAAFALVMPRLRRRGERGVVLATLGIVSAHFLIMSPAFGGLIAALGLLGLLNTAAGLRLPSLTSRALWLVDGGLKALFATLMIATLPAVCGAL